jgi:hypothetical protein
MTYLQVQYRQVPEESYENLEKPVSVKPANRSAFQSETPCVLPLY